VSEAPSSERIGKGAKRVLPFAGAALVLQGGGALATRVVARTPLAGRSARLVPARPEGGPPRISEVGRYSKIARRWPNRR
jgi:hypothetical protein